MPNTIENVSSKTAAAAVDCIRKADELLQSAVSEQETLTSKLAAFEAGESTLISGLKAGIDKLASLNSGSGASPIVTGAQKEAWYESIDSDETRKEAAVHLINTLIEKFVEPKSSESTKQAAEMGEAADLPGGAGSKEPTGPIHPTARY